MKTALPHRKKIGVTGAGGMIGSELVNRILATMPDVTVRGFYRRKTPLDHPPMLEVVVGDLLSEADCEEFVEGLDAVVHLAQANSPVASDRHWPSDCTANFTTTLTLLQAIRNSTENCHVVFASSGGAIYGDHAQVDSYHEELPCRPLSAYGIQKLAVEHYLRLAVAQGWLSACALRISNAYGAVLPPERRQGLLGVAVARHRLGLPVDVFGAMDTVRDYVHIDDIAAAIIAALECHDGFSAINVSSGVGCSVRGILDHIADVSGAPVLTRSSDFGSKQFALTPRIVLSNKKALATLGWIPNVSLNDGIRRLWNDSQSLPLHH